MNIFQKDPSLLQSNFCRRGLFKTVLAVFSIALIGHPTFSATISFVGTEPGTEVSGYAAQNWSNTNVVKSFDLGQTKKYGSAGFYQIRPIPHPPSSTIYQGVGPDNNLGIDTTTTHSTLFAPPVFLRTNSVGARVTGGAGDYVNFNSYAIFRGPDGSSLYTQGGLSVPVNQGPFNTPSGTNNAHFGTAFNFTTDMAATFRVAVAVDTVADGAYAPNYVSLFNNSSGTVFSDSLTRDGTPDMAVFEVNAVAGENFAAAMWQLNNAKSAAAFSLVAFDVASFNFNVGNGQTQTNTTVLAGAPSGLVKTGTGTQVLASANSYGGVTSVDQGRLVLVNESGLGATSGGTVVAGGAQLRLNATNGGLNVGNEALTLSGVGLSGSAGGALRSAAGTNTWQGKVTLAADATIGAASETSLTLDVASGNAIEASNRNLTFDGGGTNRINDGISLGAGGITKIGSGRAILAASNSYTGNTTVNVGVLEVASGGSIASSSTTVNSGGTLDVDGTAGAVTVNSGGTLKGDGTVSALTIATGGTLAVGNSPGQLDVTGNAQWAGGGIYSWEFDSAAGNSSNPLSGQGVNWDFLNVTGELNITADSSNKFIIDVVSLLALNDTSFDLNNNYSFAIATAAGGITSFLASDFNITGYQATATNNKWSIDRVTNSGGISQSLVLSYTGATAIPEPSTAALTLGGLSVLALLKRRRDGQRKT